MKTKWIIAFALAVMVAAAVRLGYHRRTLIATLPIQTARTTSPQMIPSFRRISLKPIKMITVGYKDKSGFNSAKNAWADIQTIINDNTNWHQRVSAIKRLPHKLTDADWAKLKAFLMRPVSSDSEQLEQAVKNQLMDSLCLMNPPPNGLDSVLTQMYGNLAQNGVIRDYALQHLATLDQILANDAGKGAVQEEQIDQKVFWNALSETGDSIAGTALLGLVRLSQQQNTDVNQDKLEAAVVQMATNNTAGELTHITAYQVCAQLDVEGALPTIEAGAQSSQTVLEQISAIGALGSMGGASALTMLQSMLQTNQRNEDRLKLPLQTAIARIETRIGQQASAQSN